MEQRPDRWPGKLTAAVVRGNTALRVRLDEDVPCVCVEIDGTPCHVLLGVTATGAENLRRVIANGLAELAARQPSAGDATQAGTNG
jgi:hypothetical protein